MNGPRATIIAACVTAFAALLVGLIGYAKESSSGHPTSITQNINSGVQVLGDVLFGGTKVSQASTSDVTAGPAQDHFTATVPDKVVFPPGTLDLLTANTSLLDGATWTLFPAPGDRNLEIDFRVVAEQVGDPQSTAVVSVRLLDDKNTLVCTTTINSATSTRNGRFFRGGCHARSYVAPAKTQTVFRAEAKVEGAKPLEVELSSVVARPRV